jgi:REP element-mobilizing transposase RayT
VHRRRAPRIQGFDYTAAGTYFVTVCAATRGAVFGEVTEDAVVRLNRVGRCVEQTIQTLPRHHDVVVDRAVVMPDHVHVILTLPGGGRSLPTIVGMFKAAASRESGVRGLWQRGFHDHVIRDDRDLERVRAYVDTNPMRWVVRHLTEQARGGRGPDTSGHYG